MDSTLDLLHLRIPPIRYVSPPACLAESSGSGSSGPTIVIEVPPMHKVTGLRVEDCILFWDALPADCEGACSTVICFNVYRADSVSGEYEVFAECVNDTRFPVSDNGCYRVSAITPTGESDLSDAVCVECGCDGSVAQEPEDLVWSPSEGFPSFDGDFSVSGDSGSFSLTTFPGQSKDYQAEAAICHPGGSSRNIIITIAYSINATTVNPPNNQAQLDVWSDGVVIGTFQVLSIGPANTSGTLVATLPLSQGPNTLFIRARASSIPAGLVVFSGSISIT